MRAVLARAREKTRKNKKKTSKKARCRNPACGQLSALLACQGTGHPCGVPPPLRGGSPSRISWPPAGAAMCPPTAYGLRGFALRLPPPPPFRGGRVALCRQGCRAYGPAALLSFTPAGSVGRSRSVKGRCAFRGWPVSSLRCGPRQPPPPPLTALPLQQPDSQTAANRSKRPVAAFFGLGGTSGRGGARKRAVGPFPGFLSGICRFHSKWTPVPVFRGQLTTPLGHLATSATGHYLPLVVTSGLFAFDRTEWQVSGDQIDR